MRELMCRLKIMAVGEGTAYRRRNAAAADDNLRVLWQQCAKLKVLFKDLFWACDVCMVNPYKVGVQIVSCI